MSAIIPHGWASNHTPPSIKMQAQCVEMASKPSDGTMCALLYGCHQKPLDRNHRATGRGAPQRSLPSPPRFFVCLFVCLFVCRVFPCSCGAVWVCCLLRPFHHSGQRHTHSLSLSLSTQCKPALLLLPWAYPYRDRPGKLTRRKKKKHKNQNKTEAEAGHRGRNSRM